MTSESEHDESFTDGPYVHHRLVGRHWRDDEDPSQCDHEVIVLGQLTNRAVATGPRRPGEGREGPATSWWRWALGEPVELVAVSFPEAVSPEPPGN